MVMRKLLAGALTAGMMLSFIPATAMAANKGWVEGDYGWRYYTSDTDYLKDTWQEIDGHWFYFYEDGCMARNSWVFIGGKLYHFNEKGHMEKNKWVEGEKWVDYYDENGKPVYSKPTWRFVGSDGAAYAGWKKIGGSWYYFDNENTGYGSLYGTMYSGLRSVDWDLYFFGDDGKMKTKCWAKDEEGGWHYFGSDGKGCEDWQQINGKWYLFNGFSYYTHSMCTGASMDWSTDKLKVWVLEDNGVLTTKKGWYQDKTSKEWYYIKSGGQCITSEWFQSSGKWYYFDCYGRMVADKTNFLINDKTYDFASSGVCKNPDSGRKVTGWLEVWSDWREDKYWVLGDKNGKIHRDEIVTYGGSKYYFDYDGFMLTGYGAYLIDGKVYSIAEDGKVTDLAGSKKGWLETDEGRCYIGSDGKAYTGWQQIGGKWYRFSTFDGTAYTHVWDIGDEGLYVFKDNGEMATGWYFCDNNWYYANSNGRLNVGKWVNIRGSWYYFNAWGEMIRDCTYLVKGNGYDFDADGKCLNPNKPHVVVI